MSQIVYFPTIGIKEINAICELYNEKHHTYFKPKALYNVLMKIKDKNNRLPKSSRHYDICKFFVRIALFRIVTFETQKRDIRAFNKFVYKYILEK